LALASLCADFRSLPRSVPQFSNLPLIALSALFWGGGKSSDSRGRRVPSIIILPSIATAAIRHDRKIVEHAGA
jgi:hypothetical protein